MLDKIIEDCEEDLLAFVLVGKELDIIHNQHIHSFKFTFILIKLVFFDCIDNIIDNFGSRKIDDYFVRKFLNNTISCCL